jgi:hypothetical protein
MLVMSAVIVALSAVIASQMTMSFWMNPGRGDANPCRKLALTANATWFLSTSDGITPESTPPSKVTDPSVYLFGARSLIG